jgi:hypothetical protein
MTDTSKTSAEDTTTSARPEPTHLELMFGKPRLMKGEGRAPYSYCVIIFRRPCLAAFAPQHGHRGRVLVIALIRRRRMVAIELGMWRSGRKGGSSGSITVG